MLRPLTLKLIQSDQRNNKYVYWMTERWLGDKEMKTLRQGQVMEDDLLLKLNP